MFTYRNAYHFVTSNHEYTHNTRLSLAMSCDRWRLDFVIFTVYTKSRFGETKEKEKGITRFEQMQSLILANINILRLGALKGNRRSLP